MLFINCSEFIFYGNYLPTDSNTNTVNLGPTCRSTQNPTRGAIFSRIADFHFETQQTHCCFSQGQSLAGNQFFIKKKENEYKERFCGIYEANNTKINE